MADPKKPLAKLLAPILEPHGLVFKRIFTGSAGRGFEFVSPESDPLEIEVAFYLDSWQSKLDCIVTATPPEVRHVFNAAGCREQAMNKWDAVWARTCSMATPANADGFFNNNADVLIAVDREDLAQTAKAYAEDHFYPFVLPLLRAAESASGLDGLINSRCLTVLRSGGKLKCLVTSISTINQVLVGTIVANLVSNPNLGEIVGLYKGFMSKYDPAEYLESYNFYQVLKYFGYQ
jgi:hypothetical protein